MRKQLFLSHAWGRDGSTHARVVALAAQLRERGWSVWLDDTDLLHGNIDAAMAEGIEGADIFAVCLTREYCDKVHRALRDSSTLDNCAKEWSCAVARNKYMLPVILEPELRRTSEWPAGVVSLHLAGTLYVDASQSIAAAAQRMNAMLLSLGKAPGVKSRNAGASPRSHDRSHGRTLPRPQTLPPPLSDQRVRRRLRSPHSRLPKVVARMVRSV